jgi:hypothetical protein
MMNQTLKERLAKAALAEVAHLEWEMLDEQDQNQIYELVEFFAQALQSEALIHVLTRATMVDMTVEPRSLLDRAIVPNEQVVSGLVSALLAHSNKSRWESR